MNIDLSHISVADLLPLIALIVAWLKMRRQNGDWRKDTDHAISDLRKECKRLQGHDDRVFKSLDSIDERLTGILERLAKLES